VGAESTALSVVFTVSCRARLNQFIAGSVQIRSTFLYFYSSCKRVSTVYVPAHPRGSALLSPASHRCACARYRPKRIYLIRIRVMECTPRTAHLQRPTTKFHRLVSAVAGGRTACLPAYGPIDGWSVRSERPRYDRRFVQKTHLAPTRSPPRAGQSAVPDSSCREGRDMRQ
jgi:hypothetical protein